ncbi:MAG: hypothetical protein AVDCRST_MAG22-259, partial [uncultured Rubrobacteraceae bacterium]
GPARAARRDHDEGCRGRRHARQPLLRHRDHTHRDKGRRVRHKRRPLPLVRRHGPRRRPRLGREALRRLLHLREGHGRGHKSQREALLHGEAHHGRPHLPRRLPVQGRGTRRRPGRGRPARDDQYRPQAEEEL